MVSASDLHSGGALLLSGLSLRLAMSFPACPSPWACLSPAVRPHGRRLSSLPPDWGPLYSHPRPPAALLSSPLPPRRQKRRLRPQQAVPRHREPIEAGFSSVSSSLFWLWEPPLPPVRASRNRTLPLAQPAQAQKRRPRHRGP